MKDLFLRQGADHRLRGGHLWVFSNEVDSERSPLGSFAAGDLVTVRNSNDKLLGSAYMEPNALICARLYAPGEQRALDVQFFAARIATALAIRQAKRAQTPRRWGQSPMNLRQPPVPPSPVP